MKQFIISILFLLAATAYAQPLPPTENPVPLDGGLLALLAAGAAYGVKKYRSTDN
jgi:hypothetical protein